MNQNKRIDIPFGCNLQGHHLSPDILPSSVYSDPVFDQRHDGVGGIVFRVITELRIESLLLAGILFNLTIYIGSALSYNF